jgi:SseB protein N-terminal domain
VADDRQAAVSLPPMVYVPCTMPSPPDADTLSIEFLEMADGRTGLPAYSALDRLVAHCGPQQPWVVLPSEKLDEVAEHVAFDFILLDVDFPAEHRRQVGD